jgi:hypothetical protein
VLSLELFPHGKGNGTLVECLVCSDGHFDLVAHTQQKNSTLGLSKSDLTDNLVKALHRIRQSPESLESRCCPS